MKREKAFHISFLILFAMLIQSCYSSVAVKGMPVSDLPPSKRGEISWKVVKEREIEELARMSAVKENKVFVETDGVPEYRIGPHDILIISTRTGDKAEEATVTVDSMGRISYSFVDHLPVTGLTPSQVDHVITKELSRYIKNPRIDILVKECNSKSAMLLGELSSLRTAAYAGQAGSGKILLKGKTNLVDLISQAGGYTQRADVRNTRLTRGGKAYTINMYDIIEKGDQRLNVIIDEGDVVEIPELPAYADQYGKKVFVMGEVKSQGIYPLKDARDLLAALTLAGSYTPLAKEQNTLIVRGYEPGKKPLVLMADVKALLREADLRQNIRLEDGDLVYVPRMRIVDINEWILNTTPLLDFLMWPGKYYDIYVDRSKAVFEVR
jgi:protein involved in polysaccharide export with SLBB domain